MTKTQRDAIIAILAVALFLFLAARNFLIKKRPAAPVASAAATMVDVGSLEAMRRNEHLLRQQESSATAPWGRDPFSAIGSTGGLALSGIVWDEKAPVAIINQKLFKTGEWIEGYEVAEIRPSSVILKNAHKEIELGLFKEAEAVKEEISNG